MRIWLCKERNELWEYAEKFCHHTHEFFKSNFNTEHNYLLQFSRRMSKIVAGPLYTIRSRSQPA
ncbi:hypothetical protein QTJ16_006578 [Diplocarpon rosae]|uniref:Uncharacterized protein n=1 Tax=Diplocarpon rosae TaxID=946125 RepID=A0AAD9WCL9_9HELO|nr:hypothetical protein QTJ16_006578 [Diplocarpon rosae]